MIARRTIPPRPLRDVPRRLWLLLLVASLLQVAWHAQAPAPRAVAQALPEAPPVALLRALSLGETQLLSRLLSLWLQAFDNQPGISIPFSQLDYERVAGWLSVSLQLDPANRYPLLAASSLYAEVADRARVRRMLAFIEIQFRRDPPGRWRWMAHAVLLAKHRLGDLPLALRLARQLTEATADAPVPGWARQMQVFVLEDSGEHAAAAALLGALLESGQVHGEEERRFLTRRLAQLREASGVEK